MKRVSKLVFTWLLVCCLLMVSMPLQTKAALTTAPTVNMTYVENRICQLAKKLGINNGTLDSGAGVYFTINQSPCGYGISGHSCSNCLNSSVVNTAWFRNIFGTVSSDGFPRQYGESGSKGSNIGWSCWGFACFAMWYVASTNTTDNVNSILAAHTTFSKTNIQNLAVPGDIIRCNGHSMLFISAGENSMKVMDCNGANASGNCRVRIRDISYSSYAGSTMAITRASNYDTTAINNSYNPEGLVNSVTSEKGTITVTGYAFDRDDLNAQLDIHVYVGGPAGSGVPCYIIKANKEKKYLDKVYPGVGDFHGINDTFKVSARGWTEVYVYAINNVKNQHNPLLEPSPITVNITNDFGIDFETNSLNMKAGNSNMMDFDFNGDGIASMQYRVEDTDVCAVAWGNIDWTQGTASLTISGKKAGETKVTVQFWDSNKAVLYEKSFNVTVEAEKGELIVDHNWLILNTTDNNKGEIRLDYGECKTIAQLYSRYTNPGIIEEAYEVEGTTVILTYTAKVAGETEVVYTAVDKYGNEIAKMTANIVVEQLVTGIELDSTNISLRKGDLYLLSATVTPSDASDKRVYWSSSDASVATVNENGMVTAVGKGEATITAEAEDGSGVCTSCKVSVKQPVTSISLSKSVLTLNKSESYQLVSEVGPYDADDKGLTWRSSDTSVATVDANGLVTAVGTGKANITVTSSDNPLHTLTCEVTVNEEPKQILVSSIVLNKTDLLMSKTDTYALVATVSPFNAANKALTWTSTNEAVAVVDANGVVTAVGSGTANIRVIPKDGSMASALCRVVVFAEFPGLDYQFADVPEGTWQYNVAKYAVMNDLMKGKGSNADGLIIFDPNNNMTRAEFVRTLYNKEGKPAVNYMATFKDVPAGQWYTNAILWAAQNDIVTGKGEIFDVNGKITRQEMATILYKYATNLKGYETAGRTGFEGYEDAGSISGWATENMKWALHYGIMKGQGTKLAPQANATRAECAAMLKNFMDIYE